MSARTALAQIVSVWGRKEVCWAARAASAASKAASKEGSKSAPAAAPAAKSPTKMTTTTATPEVKPGPKLHPVSPTLRHFLGGVSETTRTDTVKQVWEYIRENHLQDPADRKYINCDDKLKAVLGKDQVRFTEIPGLLSPHFPKKEVKKS